MLCQAPPLQYCIGVADKQNAKRRGRLAWGVFRLPEKTFCDMSLYLIGYPKIIFNFVSLVKNNFRRLPRRAYGTARNDEWRLPENNTPCSLCSYVRD
ncbi:MAG: hypothetical protein IJM09_07010 [Neisseriaceae bacterium]|nr:hypothetical protein [Neisseriaceae bacterium]